MTTGPSRIGDEWISLEREEIGVLFVDDEPGFAETAAAFVAREDDRIVIETATDADAALAILADAETDVDCVVSDYEMPGRNGIELLEAVRRRDGELPFILYTGKGSEAVASEAISAGVTDYLQKEAGTEQYVLLANRIRNAVEQYRAERTAERAERRLRELAGNTGDVLWMFSRDWSELLFVNAAYEEIWDRSASKLADDPRDFLEGIHPDDRDRVRTAMERLSSGRSVDVEYRVNESEDYGRWVWAQGEPIVDDEGAVVRIAGFVRDITERKEREAELRRTNRAMDAAPVGITISDPSREDNPLIYVNDRFEELTGYNEAEIRGQNCRILQGEATDREPVAAMRRAIDAGEPAQVELRNYRKDGTEFWNRVSIAPVRDEEGTIVNWVGFQQDVTDRKQRERELRQERAFVEQSLDALDDVFYVFSPDGEILRWNDRLEEVTGYTGAEIAGMGPTDFFPEDHQRRVADGVREVLETGSAKVQADYLTKEGERIPHEFTGVRLTDADGDVVGFVGIGRDISDRLAYERRLERHNERLDEFASIVSHDLRTPLSVAVEQLELARQERECDEEVVDDHLAAVAEAHERMDRLIEDLLALTREGGIDDRQTVRLEDVAESCWDAVGTDDARMLVDAGATLRADESRLRQLLENLLRNAIEHGSTAPRSNARGDVVEHSHSTGPAGEHQEDVPQAVEESGSGDSRSHRPGNAGTAGKEDGVIVRVGALADSDGFYVADDGPGIPPEERDRVFEIGYTTGDSGGVGLRIVERIADAHGWDVSVTEGDDGGARFEVTGVEIVERPSR